MTDTLLFCGGGSAGHLTPSLAVAEAVRQRHPGMRTVFVCAARSDETQLLKAAGLPYRTLHAGKAPDGLSLRLLTFPVLFVASLVQAVSILRDVRPRAVFSKGGYVAAPVCLAARILRIPVVLHSSDSVPNRSDLLTGRSAASICTGFPPDHWPERYRSKIAVTGNPVRRMIAGGSKAAAQRITGFSGRRPVVLVIGGSQGSVAINDAVAAQFDTLLDAADVIHLTGEGKGIGRSHARYWSRPYVTEELPHLYAMADVVVTRAGAGTLSELALLSKPAVIIPLAGVAGDHQVKNAAVLGAAGAAEVLAQDRIAALPDTVKALLASPDRRRCLGEALHAYFPADAAAKAAARLLDAAAQHR
jgi:UDP-N-acetylglucosamine--N-acetylmuramyl-(pentapeptide) pyrophosphoryl-undecaprenol N-acetylglucosamine transferase